LKKFTTKKIPAFFTGLVSTLILQSSNLVSVLVLAFVGTGIVSLTGGITVMLGSSIGTTIPDALLGSIGLNYDIKMLTLPLLFLGAVGLTFFSSHEKIIGVSKACVALGLTFLSFSFMKNGLVFVTDMVDLSSFMSMNLWIFFLIGLALTLLVQA
jgi:phosphate:Na+ symporter